MILNRENNYFSLSKITFEKWWFEDRNNGLFFFCLNYCFKVLGTDHWIQESIKQDIQFWLFFVIHRGPDSMISDTISLVLAIQF